MSGKVFLTGGTGFLGGAILARLLSAGFHVKMLVRRQAADIPPEVEQARGDLSDPDRLARQMRDCCAVFHSAALVSSWVPEKRDFYRVNVEGLSNIMEACRRSGTGALIYTSSFFTLGPARIPGASEASSYVSPGIHPYEHSKFLARKLARQALASGFPLVILYPGVIYGPGRMTRGNLVGRMLGDFLAGRVPGLLGDGTQAWSYAHADDVARGHLLALERAAAGGEYVLGGDNVPLRDFYGLASKLTGRSAPRFHIPPWLAAVAGAVEFGVARFRGRMPSMTPATVRMMCHDWALDSGRAETELGYRCRPLEQGLRETLRDMGVPVIE